MSLAKKAARDEPEPGPKGRAPSWRRPTAPASRAATTSPQEFAISTSAIEGDGRFVWMEHAERNAIFEAAKRGAATKAATLATTFFPCIDCARAIVQAGIARLCTPAPDYADAVWGQAFLRSRVILEEGGVAMHFVATDESAARSRRTGLACRRRLAAPCSGFLGWPLFGRRRIEGLRIAVFADFFLHRFEHRGAHRIGGDGARLSLLRIIRAERYLVGRRVAITKHARHRGQKRARSAIELARGRRANRPEPCRGARPDAAQIRPSRPCRRCTGVTSVSSLPFWDASAKPL